MKRTIFTLGIITMCWFLTAQPSYYYSQEEHFYLNENPLVRYVELQQTISFEQATAIHELLNSCCWRTDEFTPFFNKYYINQDKYVDFQHICQIYNSIICLHTPNYANEDTSIFYPTRIVLVKIKPNIDLQNVLTDNNILFTNIVQSKYNQLEYCIYLPNDSALSYAAQLYETGLFFYAQPDFMGTTIPLGYYDNPMFSNQWAIHNPNTNMNILSAWEVTTGHPKINVAVVDSGVDLYHPDLVGNLLEGYDAVNDLQYPSTVCCGEYESSHDFHGTCCAGVIGAENNDTGLVGIAHTSKIIPVRCGHHVLMNIVRDKPNHEELTQQWVWQCRTLWLVDALNHACYDDNTDVVNCSLGLMYQSDPVLNKVTEICEQGRNGKGCIVVVGAGNSNVDNSLPTDDTLNFLSRHPKVISVGSITPCGKRVKKGEFCEIESIYNSCYGDSLDVVAPGIQIPTTMVDSKYINNFSGTSSAAPHVAGLSALILSVNPCLTRDEVKFIIESTCTKVRSDIYNYISNPDHPNGTWNIEVGYGLVNAGAALALVQQMGGYTYVNDTLISADTLWNTNRLINQNLVIDSLVTLTITDTVFCTPSSRIIVRPGGKIIVDGGTLTSACAGEMWQGICVEGHTSLPQTAACQGTVQLLNGATIENALCGILTCNPADSLHTTGGIITADSAVFRNCVKAVEYLPFVAHNNIGYVTDNWGSFNNCTFTVDDNNLFAANNMDFLAHVTMWDVKGVRFTHCRFEDMRTQSHTRKSAISTIDAGFKVRTDCDYTLPRPDCNCYLTTNTYCSFTGFGTAISAATSGNPYAVTIDGARFIDNVTGVGISGNSHAEVTRCIFHLDSIIPDYRSVTGLSLSGCTGYLVEENTFTRVATSPSGNRYGIQVVASGTDANSLYRNTFERLTRGITVSGINGDGDSHTGLQMSCNGFTNNTYDMYIASGATVCDNQGSTSKGADNTFSGTQTSSLYSAGSQSLTYHHSAGSSHAPYNPTTNYVTVNGTAGSNMCGSTICGYNPGNPGGGPKSPTPGFLSLKEQYDNLTADFNRNGYAEVLGHADVNTYDAATIAAAENAAQQISAIAAELYAQSHAAVRALMADTQEDIPAIWEWLNATPGLASRYLAVEAGFVAGADAVEAHGRASLQDIATQITASAERDEYDNYVAFQALKDALSYGNGHVAWPHATDAQVWELVRIADANTGRSSLLAKNVLCFFFGICYDDDMETRALTTTAIPPLAESPALTESRITAEPQTLTGQQRITVHPNPTHDVLRVAVTEGDAGIAFVEMFDMFGRAVSVETHGRASLPSPTLTVNTSAIPSGVYVLRVTLTDGAVRTVKVVKD